MHFCIFGLGFTVLLLLLLLLTVVVLLTVVAVVAVLTFVFGKGVLDCAAAVFNKLTLLFVADVILFTVDVAVGDVTVFVVDVVTPLLTVVAFVAVLLIVFPTVNAAETGIFAVNIYGVAVDTG